MFIVEPAVVVQVWYFLSRTLYEHRAIFRNLTIQKLRIFMVIHGFINYSFIREFVVNIEISVSINHPGMKLQIIQYYEMFTRKKNSY